MKHDNVNNPKHYCSHPSKVECITLTRKMNFDVGNAFKYVYRYDHKGHAEENILKAIWYIRDEIQRRNAFWFRLFREPEQYCPRIEGCSAIKDVLRHEDRGDGLVCWILDRLYTAHTNPRSVEESLVPALIACQCLLNKL